MSQQTITGELRKWHREKVVERTGVVIGYMYHDVNDIWEDGEEAVIHYVDWVVSTNFSLAVTAGGGCIKCPNDEERFNGQVPPPIANQTSGR